MRGSWAFATLVAATLVSTVTGEHCRSITATFSSKECPKSDPQDTWIKLPDEKDCGNYFRCMGGHKFPEKCPADLHFQPSLGHCMPPMIAGCNHTFTVPHEKSCKKYYKIENGRKFIEKCKKGKYFSPAEKKCMAAAKSGCKQLGPCDGEPEGYVYADTKSITKYWLCEGGRAISKNCPRGLYLNDRNRCETVKSTLDRESRKKSDSRTSKNPYRRACSSNTKIAADESDCSKYYVCRNDKEVSRKCPPGLHFHRCLELCVEPKIAGCKYTFKVPNDKDCAKYYEIKNNVKTEMTCEPGLYFSPTSKQCTIFSESGCEQMSGQCDGNPEGHVIAHKNNCAKYWICENGNPIPGECPSEAPYLNSHNKTCYEDPEESYCDVLILERSKTCFSCYSYLRGERSEIKCREGLEFSWTKKICVDPQESDCDRPVGRCENGSKTAHSSQCERYWTCRDGSWTYDKCRESLCFNSVTNECDEQGKGIWDRKNSLPEKGGTSIKLKVSLSG